MTVVVALVACGPSVAVDGAQGTSSDDGGGSGSATATVGSSSTVGTSASSGPLDTGGPGTTTDETRGDDDSNDEGVLDTVGFICRCDGGNVSQECDPFVQDCPEEEKCMPWANDGGGVWNGTRCSPLDPRPPALGEPCVVEGSGVSGIDNCGRGAMCWGVDPATNEGTCAELCSGSADAPHCEVGGCFVDIEVALAICLTPCDPFAPDCGDEVCTLDEATATSWCVPPIVVWPGAYGEPCEPYRFNCGGGLACVEMGNVADCVGVECCTALCDPALPSACPEGELGQICIPFDADPAVGFCGYPD
ncbi:MAG: hypothetical protein IAG13_15070 [Deltaproteobacteria bacterium]|nr:hypothetical protein [Nannocystaceae bacterium]